MERELDTTRRRLPIYLFVPTPKSRLRMLNRSGNSPLWRRAGPQRANTTVPKAGVAEGFGVGGTWSDGAGEQEQGGAGVGAEDIRVNYSGERQSAGK